MSSFGRWLSIDHGTRRIGLAVGNMSDKIASPIKVIQAGNDEQVIRQILATAQEYEVEGLIVGWPLNMDDTEGPQGRLARAMGSQLAQATALPVIMWDERLSSFVADQALAGHLTRMKRRSIQDALAAATILQDFFDAGGPASPKAKRLE
jgi:putative Holliday junction resolvase